MATLVSVDKRWAFVHTPKTGGTWLTSALRAHVSESYHDLKTHVYADELFRQHLVDEQTTLFSLVRAPIPWYKSHWMHFKMYNDLGENKKGLSALGWTPDIDESLKPGSRYCEHWTSVMRAGTDRVTFKLKFEDFRNSSELILRFILGRKFKPALLKTPVLNPMHGPTPTLRQDTIDNLLAANAEMIKALGYDGANDADQNTCQSEILSA